MGWFGIALVGAVVGFVGWRLQPAHAAWRWWWAVLAGALAAALTKMAGNVLGLYGDGDTLEWLVSVSMAILVVTLIGVLRPSR